MTSLLGVVQRASVQPETIEHRHVHGLASIEVYGSIKIIRGMEHADLIN